MSELQKTLEWFKIAVPDPTLENKCVQIGCDIEEDAEKLWAIGCHDEARILFELSDKFKSKEGMQMSSAESSGNEELFDALLDRIVTTVGVCHMFGFDAEKGLAEVNRSNFSKFEDGKPVFDENGKIKKGENYSKPDLSKMIK